MAEIRVKINNKRLISMLNNVESPITKIAIYNTLAKRCDPYVPFLNGPLSQTARITEEGVLYNQPYARRQYYGVDFNHTLEYHPLASAKWDQAMMQDHREEFIQEVKDIIVRGLKDGS